MKLAVIAAVAENGVIGRDGRLPWRLSADLKRFKELTRGHPVIVGRKTFESIVRRLGHPLPDRVTIVVTRQENYPNPHGVGVVHSLDEAIAFCEGASRVYVIGGAELYREAIPRADLLYITRVFASPDGDVRMPAVDKSQWLLVRFERHGKDEKNEFDLAFEEYERVPSTSFVELDNARVDEQRELMERIAASGECPFCTGSRWNKELQPILHQGVFWKVRENRWPYENARVHLLFILNQHGERFDDLPQGAGEELFCLCAEMERRYAVESGAVSMRFGDTSKNGATVRHLHAHLIVAGITDREHPDYKPVRFRVG